MKVIVFIPARGGSKGIPGKNIKPLAGKPLIYWVSKAAQDSTLVDKVVVATDCPRIKETALSFKFSKLEVFDRSPANSTDTAQTEDVMLEFIHFKGLSKNEGLMVLLQATSPLTTSQDINEGIKTYKSQVNSARDRNTFDPKFASVVSVTPYKRFLWQSLYDSPFIKPINYNPTGRPLRQEISDNYFQENGAFYIGCIKYIALTHSRIPGVRVPYIMSEKTAIELDSLEDWEAVERLMNLEDK